MRLKLFNGGAFGVMPESTSCGHLYAAAESWEDLHKLITEHFPGANMPWVREYLRKHWYAGTWGSHMDGIEAVRGLWYQPESYEAPRRVNPPRPSVKRLVRRPLVTQ